MQDLIHSIILYSSHTFIGCILVGNNSFSVGTHIITFTGLSGFAGKSIFALKRSGGLVTGFSNIDYLRTGNQQQWSGRSGYQLFHH